MCHVFVLFVALQHMYQSLHLYSWSSLLTNGKLKETDEILKTFHFHCLFAIKFNIMTPERGRRRRGRSDWLSPTDTSRSHHTSWWQQHCPLNLFPRTSFEDLDLERYITRLLLSRLVSLLSSCHCFGVCHMGHGGRPEGRWKIKDQRSERGWAWKRQSLFSEVTLQLLRESAHYDAGYSSSSSSSSSNKGVF